MTLQEHAPGSSFCSGNETFCNFPDYDLVIVRENTFAASQSATVSRSWDANSLYNQSFEDGYASYAFINPSTVRQIECTPGSGFGSDCYLSLRPAGSSTLHSVYQDVPYPVQPGDEFSAEVMVRCKVKQTTPNCAGTLAVWGYGGAGLTDERRRQNLSIPSDGQWYLCRLDQEHGFEAGFVERHNFIRWELYVLGPNALDVDFTHLGGFTDRITGTAGDFPSKPLSLPTCSLAGSFDNGNKNVAGYGRTNFVGEMKLRGNRTDTEVVKVVGHQFDGDPTEVGTETVSSEIARSDNESVGWVEIWAEPRVDPKASSHRKHMM
ncbi:MAG TPA: hypothetical protein VM142_08770 [Acidimicrobiales bacterium]|nr:hypothetical protein [Acidimicrobiales bacterium]